jgi:hypothetical protein
VAAILKYFVPHLAGLREVIYIHLQHRPPLLLLLLLLLPLL